MQLPSRPLHVQSLLKSLCCNCEDDLRNQTKGAVMMRAITYIVLPFIAAVGTSGLMFTATLV